MGKKINFSATAVILYSFFILTGCSGSVGKNGAYLKKYLPEEELKKLIETSVEKKDDIYNALYDPADLNYEYPIWIIDTRSETQYKNGHIPKSKSYPYWGFSSDWYDGIPKDVNLIVHCETGGRAQMAVWSLNRNGYTRWLNWGGIIKWNGELIKEPEAEK